MKRLLTLFAFLNFVFQGLTQDLPGPPSNNQTLNKGSYIIPMDNTYQLNSAGYFNLKAYGLIVYLLDNSVKLKWVIRAGKAKDGIDFTTTCDLVKPSATATNLSRNFKGGPFVVYKNDTAGVAALVQAYYASMGLSGADRPNLYVNNNSVSVDQRYDLTGYIPKGAVLTDGGNQSIHLGYMVSAGIPAANYTTSQGDNLTNCFTFASEPHNTNSGPAVDSAITHIKSFVQLGGNFLAQCAAVSNYENDALGHFQTSTGITVPNTNIDGSGLSYPNPDLSYSQFEGSYFSYDGQSVVQNWLISAVGINNEHNHGKGSGAYTNYLFATAAKLRVGLGGMVYYLNCHDYNGAGPLNSFTTNGIRMYMNAFLTPSVFLCPLPLSLISFSGTLKNGAAELKWTVAENETGDHFELEKSYDGKNFSISAAISTSNKYGLESYIYNEPKISAGNIYYRLKMVNKNFSVVYSKIIILKDEKQSRAGNITILENPVNTSLTFIYASSDNGIKTVNIYNSLGAKVYSNSISTLTGSNTISLGLADRITKGVYIMEINNGTQRSTAKLIKQ